MVREAIEVVGVVVSMKLVVLGLVKVLRAVVGLEAVEAVEAEEAVEAVNEAVVIVAVTLETGAMCAVCVVPEKTLRVPVLRRGGREPDGGLLAAEVPLLPSLNCGRSLLLFSYFDINVDLLFSPCSCETNEGLDVFKES